jgi:hypothetical protein
LEFGQQFLGEVNVVRSHIVPYIQRTVILPKVAPPLGRGCTCIFYSRISPKFPRAHALGLAARTSGSGSHGFGNSN